MTVEKPFTNRTSVPRPFPQGSGTSSEEGAEIFYKPEFREDWRAVMSSQHTWFPAEDQCSPHGSVERNLTKELVTTDCFWGK